MNSPDITKAQIASVVAALVAVIGVVQTAPERLQMALIVVLGAVAVAWIVSDAILRHGRAGVAAAQHQQAAAEVTAAAATAHLDQGDLPGAPAA